MTGASFEVYKYIAVMVGVTYLIRVLPLTLIRREIRNVRVRAFLHYVPYVTLSVMTFPAILHATKNVYSGAAGFATALLMAWSGQSLFRVSLAACVAVFAVEFFL
ncbi:AzlD domain-containing protein [Synergistaceae bacterium OttesenSCG-928-I11]|nr:AzlD domain-containing protein [Synergistaceae bacterium OttesenSCG-928-I11]